MSELSQVSLQRNACKSSFCAASGVQIDPALLGSRKKLPLKDSVFACGFMGLYLAVYLAVGFAGIKAIGWVWTTIFS